jgi:hypothetical protein
MERESGGLCIDRHKLLQKTTEKALLPLLSTPNALAINLTCSG